MDTKIITTNAQPKGPQFTNMCICGLIVDGQSTVTCYPRANDLNMNASESPTHNEYRMGFSNFLDSGIFSDMTITFADNTEMKAHRFVIGYWSLVIKKALFAMTMSESINAEYKLYECNPELAKKYVKLLYYMPYVPISMLSVRDALDLLPLAHRLDTPSLFMMCADRVRHLLRLKIDRKKTKAFLHDEEMISLIGCIICNWQVYSADNSSKLCSTMIQNVLIQIVQIISMSLKSWISHGHSADLARALDYKTMLMIVKSCSSDLVEKDVIRLLIQWIFYHFSDDDTDSTSNGKDILDYDTHDLTSDDVLTVEAETKQTDSCGGVMTQTKTDDDVISSDDADSSLKTESSVDPNIIIDTIHNLHIKKIHITEDALNLLEHIKWGDMSKDDYISIYNTIQHGASLPLKFRQRIEGILLEASLFKDSKSKSPNVKNLQFPFVYANKKRKHTHTSKTTSKKESLSSSRTMDDPMKKQAKISKKTSV